MRRIPVLAALAAGIFLCVTAWAQELSFRGVVDKVDPVDMMITLRMTNNPRVLPISPSAVIMIGGQAGKLDQIPLNSLVDVIAQRDAQGVPRVTRISVEGPATGPSAAAPPGSVVRGTIVGIDVSGNSIIVRSNAGDARVDLGTAPVISNGRQTSIRAIHYGDTVEVQREIPTPGGAEYVTKTVMITGPAGAAQAGNTTASGRAQSVQGVTSTVNTTRTGRVYGFRNAAPTGRVAGYKSTMKTRRVRYRNTHRASRSSRYARASHAASFRSPSRSRRTGYQYARSTSYRRRYRARRASYRHTYRFGGTGGTQALGSSQTAAAARTIPAYRPATPAQHSGGYQTQMWHSRPR